MSDAAAPKKPDAIKSFISGGFGGICLVLVGHPFDTIKVRLQTSSHYSGAMDCLKKTVAQDGAKGLYRGMATPLAGVTPVFSICFWGYDMGKRMARSMWGSGDKPLSMSQIMWAGGFSAVPTTLIMTPMERIKCLLQIQGMQKDQAPKYAGPADAAKQIFKESGITGIYKGTGLTLMRDIPGSVAYFGAYEYIKKAMTPKGAKPEDLSPLAVMTAGGMAGIANWLVAIPPDVLKSRFQTAAPGTYKGIMDVFSTLVKTEGPSALFKGLGPILLRAFPANAACFLGMEVSLNALNKMW